MRLTTVFCLLLMLCMLVLILYTGCFFTLAITQHTDQLDQDIIQIIQQQQEIRETQLELYRRQEQLLDIFSGADVKEVEVTAYTLECGTGDGYTATMTRPEVGRTVAVDPRVLPLGSRVWLTGLGWHIAEDTGGAVRGNIIDRYVGSGPRARVEAYAWGRRELKAIVVMP